MGPPRVSLGVGRFLTHTAQGVDLQRSLRPRAISQGLRRGRLGDFSQSTDTTPQCESAACSLPKREARQEHRLFDQRQSCWLSQVWPGKITTTVERRQAASDSGVPEGSLGGMDGVVTPPRRSTPASMSELQDEVVILNVPCL